MKYIGYFLISLPFIVMASAMVYSVGWSSTLLYFGIIAAILGCVIGGMMLIERSDQPHK